MLKLENLVILPEKNDFLIGRGMRTRHFSITPKGDIVVKLKGFDRYYFDPQTDEVYSRRGDRCFRKLMAVVDGSRPFYYLYRHGVKSRVYKSEILRDNLHQIEIDLRENSGKNPENCDVFKLVS